MSIMKYIIIILLLIVNTAIASQQMTIYVNSSPGSGVDNGARFIAPLIEKEINEKVVIIDMPGADGLIGLERYNRTNNDCTAILASQSSIPFIAKTRPELDFNPMKQYTPVHGLTNNHILIIVSATSTLNSISDIINRYKTNGHLSASAGSRVSGFEITQLDSLIGTTTNIVYYTMYSQMAIDIVNNRIDYAVIPQGSPAVQGLIDSGQIKIIGVMDNTRSKFYNSVKTVAEQGYPNKMVLFSWNGFFIKSSESQECKDKITKIITKVMNSNEVTRITNLPGSPSLYLIDGYTLGQVIKREFEIFKPLKE